MPSILLINDNKIVSRLLQLSSKKHNYDLEEISDYNPSNSNYNVIFVDSHKYNASNLKKLTDALTYDKLGFIGSKNSDIPSEFDIAIEKPFLPTDFVSLIDESFKVVDPSDEKEEKEEAKLDELEELPSLDEPKEEELAPIKELKEDESLEELEIPETTLSTGIVNNLHDVSEKNELTEPVSVSEIDTMMIEEPIEDLTLEDLKIDDSLDSIDDKKESTIENIEDEIDASLATIVEEEETKEDPLPIPEEIIEPLESPEDEKKSELPDDNKDEDIKVEEKDDAPSSVMENLATAAVVAGAGVVAVNSLNDNKETEIENMIDELDGIENIEKESDYLAHDFNALDEDDIVKALEDESDKLDDISPEKEDLETPIVSAVSDLPIDEKEEIEEEIISEEISTDGEERVVEPSDLEDMIQKAVAASITPELLQKALEGMDINLSLSFAPKSEEADS